MLAGILQRDADDLSATGQIRQAREWAGGTGHLLTLWSAAVRQTLYPKIDQQIKARLTDSEAWRYEREPSRPVLQNTLRDAQLAGRDISAIIDRITAAPMDGARSIASVLHGRLQRLQLPAQGHGVTWAQRTPENAPALAHELAAGLDDRHRELGVRALANPEPWLTRHLGPPPGRMPPRFCGKTTHGGPARPRPTGKPRGSLIQTRRGASPRTPDPSSKPCATTPCAL